MILVTGFQPFLEDAVNPSEQLLEELKSHPSLVTLLLPVEFDLSFNNLKIHLQQKFDFILMLGLASQSKKIRLERVALNLEDGKSADNGGALRQGHLIEISGPPAIFSHLPINQWAQALGDSVEVSNHAGTYVCNSLYYKTLRHTQVPSLFVHVPRTSEMELSEMRRIIESLLELVKSARSH